MSNIITAGNATNNGTSISSDTSGVLELKTGSTPTTAITVDASQNVGIGITTPDSSNKLQVAGDVAVSWDANKFIGMKFGAGTSYKMGLVLNNTTRECKVWSQSSDSDDKITFYSGPTPSERMRIDSSGNLLVGQTTNSTAAKVGITYTNGTTNGIILTTNGTAASNAVMFYNANGNIGNIVISGSATTYGTSSDYRLKNNIAGMTGALAKVAQLKPVTYKWNVDNSDGEGFIAHELAEVVPQCVIGEKDAVDSDGNPVYQGIDTSFLVATLTAAIQELKAELDATKAEVAALKGA